MSRVPVERVAYGAVAVLFLAIVRTLGEYYRLRWALGPDRGMRAFEPFIGGLLLAQCGLAIVVFLCFWRQFRLAVWISGVTLAAMLVYKLVAIPSAGGTLQGALPGL